MAGSVITLQEAKDHLRVTDTAQDSTITLYIGAACEYIQNVVDSPIPGMDDPNGKIPFSLKAAALLTVADLFENREGAGEKDIKENPAVMRLLHFYRNNMGI